MLQKVIKLNPIKGFFLFKFALLKTDVDFYYENPYEGQILLGVFLICLSSTVYTDVLKINKKIKHSLFLNGNAL